MEEANNIFFDSLDQYATDSSAAKSIIESVEFALKHAPELETLPEAERQRNLRWFSDRPRAERVQILALTKAVKKVKDPEGGRIEYRKHPAESRLGHLELAAAIYRLLRRKKTAVSQVVESANIQTKAAYLALVRSNLELINQLRSVKKTRNWTKISEALKVVTGKKIPPTTLAKVYAEVTEGVVVRLNAQTEAPAMAHFVNEHIDRSTREAYEKAGYDTSGEAVPWQGQEPKLNRPAMDESAGAQPEEAPGPEEKGYENGTNEQKAGV